MKTGSKLIIFVVLALGLWVLYLWHSATQENKRLQKSITDMQATIATKPKLVKVDSIIYQDVEHNIYRDVIVNRDVPVEKKMAIGQPLLDSITQALKIKEKDLLAVRQINAHLSIENQKLNETTKGKLEFRDNYFYVKIDKDSNTLDKMNYNLVLNDVDYEKRQGFLRPKQQLIDIFSPDKRISIGGVKSFTVKPKQLQSRLYVSNNLMFSPKNDNYNILSSQLKFQAGLNNTLTWSLGGGYMTNFKDFYPIISTELQINLFKIRK